jgi:Flp pilus assembly protein TadB
MGNFSKRNPGEGDDGKSPPANEPSTCVLIARGGSRKLVRGWRFVVVAAITIKRRFLKRIRGARTPLFSSLPRKKLKKIFTRGWRSPDRLPLDPPLLIATLCSTIIAFLFILGFTVYYAVQNIRNNNLSMAAFYRRPSLREGDFVDKLGLMILFFVILIIIAAALFHLAIIINKRAEDIMKRVKAIQTRRRQNQD